MRNQPVELQATVEQNCRPLTTRQRPECDRAQPTSLARECQLTESTANYPLANQKETSRYALKFLQNGFYQVSITGNCSVNITVAIQF